jgi:hypothetical protein
MWFCFNVEGESNYSDYILSTPLRAKLDQV